MAAGTTIKLKRKAGAFAGAELAAGEAGIDTTNGKLYISKEGTTVTQIGRGKLLQMVSASYATQTSGTTTIPTDGTIPQKTEGTEILSASLTPSSATNRLLIFSNVVCSASGTVIVTSALFQDATSNALADSPFRVDANANINVIPLVHEMAAGTTSSTTIKVNLGTNGGTWYVNRRGSGTGEFSSGTKSTLIVFEIEP